jgi:hypothetical protein
VGCEVRTMFIVYLAAIFLGLALMLAVALRHLP